MRLLVVASTFPATDGDGTPGFVRDLAVQEAEDFDVLVLVPRVPGAARRERIGPVEVRRFAYFPRRFEDLAHGAIIENLRAKPSRWLQVPCYFLAQTWAIHRTVRRWRPDVMHVHWIIPQGVSARLAARSVPQLLTTLGGDLYALRHPLVQRLKSLVVRRARFTTVMNADMRERVVELGADPDDVRVLPMGASNVGGAVPPAGRRSATGLTVLFVGRLVPKKGLGVLLDALRALGRDDVRLEVVGDGPLRAEVEQQSIGLPVHFRGQLGRDDLMAAYATADVAVFPSVPAASGDQDGLPVALLEAMAAGCAVVASDLPGLSEAVADGESGRLVPSQDVAALADALRTLTEDDALRDRLSEGARRQAQEFSVESIGARYRELLRTVAGAADRARPSGRPPRAPARPPAGCTARASRRRSS